MDEQEIDANAVIEHLLHQVAQQAKQIAILQTLLQQSQQVDHSYESEEEVA